jgi:UMF1 family MFS transporter
MPVDESSAIATAANKSEGGGTRKIVAWTIYDWANSSFTTIVVSFIYSGFFTQVMVRDDVLGQALWGRAVSVSALFIAVISPIVGAMADRGGKRRYYLFVSTMVCVVATALLTFVAPDMPNAVLIALTVFVIANVGFEVSSVFYNSFLPVVAPPDRVGTISGIGWGVGYLAGIVSMVIALFAFIGFAGADPWLSLSTEGAFNVRAVNLLVAGWFFLFSIPMFIWVKDEAPAGDSGSVREAFVELKRTFQELRKYSEIAKLLFARLLYNDGIGTIFVMIGPFAMAAFDWQIDRVILFGITANVTAGLGAFIFGFVDDKVGGKKTIMISVVFLTLGILVGAMAQNETFFWLAALTASVFAGPNQAASRSLMARFTPESRQAEFFGFYAFSGKVTTFAGPLLVGIVGTLFHSVRAGIAVVAIFFVAGGVALSFVDEAKGIEAGL